MRRMSCFEQLESRAMLAADLFFGLPNGAQERAVVSNAPNTRQSDLVVTPQDDLFVDFAVDRSGDATVTFDLAVRVDGVLVAASERLTLGPLQFIEFDDVELGRFAGGDHVLELEILNAVPDDDLSNNILTTRFRVESGDPDLVPYQLPGWDDIITVSPVEDNSGADTPVVSDTDNLFIDFGLKNIGTDSVTDAFKMRVFLDQATDPIVEATISGELFLDTPESFQNILLPELSVGQHTLRLEVDAADAGSPFGSVSETNEENNTYSRTFYVAGSASISGTVFNDADLNGLRDASDSAIANATVFLDLNHNGAHDQSIASVDALLSPLVLADVGTTAAHVVVANAQGRIVDVDVKLDMKHTDLSQLRVSLVSPQGDHVVLVSAVGGGDLAQTLFDDEAESALSEGVSPFDGRFQPNGSLEKMAGGDANGRWTLLVEDFDAGAMGTLNSWSMTITTEEPRVETLPDGSYTFEHLAAGVYRVAQKPISGFEIIGTRDVDFIPPETVAGLDIQFRIDPKLLPNPGLQRALAEAASIVESLFFDPITVVVDVKFADSDGLASADSVLFLRTYVEARDLLQNDSAADEQVVLALPPLDMSFLVPNSFSVEDVTVTRANLLALGVPPSLLTEGDESEFDPTTKRDAQIVYNVNRMRDFDFDRSDGIAFDKHDFVGTTVHEILHVLGFVSEVENVKLLLEEATDPRTGQPRPLLVNPAVLDLFRMAPGTAATDFASGTRILVPGAAAHVFDGGAVDATAIDGVENVGEIPMSDGETQQAGHLLDDTLTGVRLGVMDPTTMPGHLQSISSLDARVMGLIGWDLGTNQFDGHTFAISAGGMRSALEFANRTQRLDGDANNDGEVSFDDFTILARNFAKTSAIWEEGDFDGNGTVEFDDFLLLVNNFGRRRA